MRKVISLILALLLLSSTASATYTERKGDGAEQFLWDELSKHSPNDYVTAAVLSYFWRESQYRSDAVAGWASSLHGYGIDLCDKVTTKTDRGLEDGSSRDYFIRKARRHGGYGLGQWYRTSYLEDLYDYAQKSGESIGSAEMQCGFVVHSLKQNKQLWRCLKRCKDAEKAGRLLAIYYDGSPSAADYMGYKAKVFFEKYHEG